MSESGFGTRASGSDEFLRRCLGDLVFFAERCLRVRTKRGLIRPLVLNESQLALHAACEDQIRRRGWVRKLVSKGRQQGVSTYTGGRFYRRTAMERGVNTFILAHEQPAVETLFNMVDMFQRNNPIAPHVGASNIRELVFDRLGSQYSVGVATESPPGRSKATTLYHGSEVAFWKNASGQFSASVQTVPDEPGTEVILESTSNGPGGEFYERVQDALAGIGDYELEFLPWFMAAEYRREPEPGFELSDETVDGDLSEVEYATTFGLDMAQMAWRRAKIQTLKSLTMFKQEYPSTVSESFQNPKGFVSYISHGLVIQARKRVHIDGVGTPLVIGVDPASQGGDRFAAAGRRGPCVEWVRTRNRINEIEGAAWVCALIDEHDPARVNIDVGGIGSAIYTLVKARGPRYERVTRPVNFGGTSQAKMALPKRPGPINRRAEMYERLLEWLKAEEGVRLPDRDDLQADICAPKQVHRLDNNLQLEAKKDMRARGVRSPDLADAVALTFASKEHLVGSVGKRKSPAYGESIDRPVHIADEGYGPHASAPGSWMV